MSLARYPSSYSLELAETLKFWGWESADQEGAGLGFQRSVNSEYELKNVSAV